MWGYQEHFRAYFQSNAKHLFEKLDAKLNPRIFFLGVLVDNMPESHPICLEPEDCGYDVNCFKDLINLAAELEKVDGEKNLLHSHPIAQEQHDKRIKTKSFTEAIDKILTGENLYEKVLQFVAPPAKIEGYWVFPILLLNKEAWSRHYILNKNRCFDRYRIYQSLIDSAVEVFLEACSQALGNYRNSGGRFVRTTDELLAVAAKNLMYTASSAGENIDGLHLLYDACNEIASLKYEGAVGIGRMLIASKDHENIKLSLQLKEPIKLSDFRKVRKFLEVTDKNSSIVTDSFYIYGLGQIVGEYNPVNESLFEVSFNSHYRWELSHNNNVLMLVEYRVPSLPKVKIDRNSFCSTTKRIFKEISSDQISDLWDIVLEATRQKKGAILVISGAAENEAGRLGKQSFELKPIKINNEIVKKLTAIDGAVLLNRDSICFAIGVILDGVACQKGDSSRGARYNSAIRYYEF
jgi:hypothetical protein